MHWILHGCELLKSHLLSREERSDLTPLSYHIEKRLEKESDVAFFGYTVHFQYGNKTCILTHFVCLVVLSLVNFIFFFLVLSVILSIPPKMLCSLGVSILNLGGPGFNLHPAAETV